MPFGKLTLGRLLSPLVALLWILAVIGFAGTARADSSARSNAGDARQASAQEKAHAAPDVPSVDHRNSAPEQSKAASAPATKHGGTSGDVNKPQPISNADANTGGANGQCPGGPYCSTRDGSSSGNGNGGGKATGKPCAGCVGKADNKNPRGQLPDASDANAGYECDTNHGIARTNPAHTGCQQAPPPCVPTPTVPCVPSPPCVPTPTVPCAPIPPSPPTNEGAPTPVAVVSPPSSGLPNTGAPENALGLGIAAIASILAGTGLVLRRGRMSS